MSLAVERCAPEIKINFQAARSHFTFDCPIELFKVMFYRIDEED